MPARRKIDKKTFSVIKALLNGGTSVKEICSYMDVSDNTVYRIRACESHEEYVVATTEHRIAAANPATLTEAEKRAIQAPVSVGDKVYGANRICELLTHQNELLKGIMNKVAFIVDELTGIPSPKDGDQ